MPRHSGAAASAPPATAPTLSTPERLLAAGLARARTEGLRRLTVRAVAQDAGINLGSFVYHFGSREAFIGQLIEHWYAPLLARAQGRMFASAARSQGADMLLAALMDVVDIVLEERQFIGQLVADAAAGEAPARAFLQSCGDRHPALLLHAITLAQAAGELREADPRHLLLMFMSAIGLPVLLFESLSGRDILPLTLVDAFEAFALQRTHIEARLGWVLEGLRPPVGVAR
jgi:AcrR family transcriptional regulator